MVGEVSNLSEEADKSKIDFLRGIRGGMRRQGFKGNLGEPLICKALPIRLRPKWQGI